MKTSFIILLFSIVIVSCRITIDNTEILVSNTMISGSWEVTHFEKFDSVLTENYEDYVFHFNSDGSINVQSENEILGGSWSITDRYVNQGVVQDLRFNLFFNESQLTNLTGNWDIDFFNNNTLRLVNFSVNNGEDILIVFEKV